MLLKSMGLIVSTLLLVSAPYTAIAKQSLALSSSAFVDGGTLPVRYTCEGEGTPPPLNWTGVPTDTQSLVLIMDHKPSPRAASLDEHRAPIDAMQPKPSAELRWYWTVYNIAPDAMGISNDQPVGIIGSNAVNSINAYAPPCSKGPGIKGYRFHLYALSTMLEISQTDVVSEATLRSRIQGLVLDADSLAVNFERSCRFAPNAEAAQPHSVTSPIKPNPLQANEHLAPREPPPILPLCTTTKTVQ